MDKNIYLGKKKIRMSGSVTTDILLSAKKLIEFIDLCPSPYHVVHHCTEKLREAGFKPLSFNTPWDLQKGGKYYVNRNSALIAFQLGTGEPELEGSRIISSHTDSPCWKVKPLGGLTSEGHYLKLNTEVYGGPIINTWMDRPLSLAGRVVTRSNDTFSPNQQLINIDRPLLVIPNLAIHLNRSVNEGVELNKQTDLLPLAGTLTDALQKENWLLQLLATELGIDSSDILDFDLFVYPYEPGCILGTNNEFISAPRLDNLAMVQASITALCAAPSAPFTQMVCLFDNEEVGSVSKQGAGSPLLRHIFERIMFKLGKNAEEVQMAIYQSFMISADMAHALHPNRGDKYDPVLRPLINKGPVIKVQAGQKYTTDADSGAVYASICENNGIPFQKYANRSDIAGGSTLGNISSTQLDIRTVDIGSPMLAMHSARELAGTVDHWWITESLGAFFEE